MRSNCKMALVIILSLVIIPTMVNAKTYTIKGDNGGKVWSRFVQVVKRVKAGHSVRFDGLCASACTINLRFGRRACATRRAKIVFHGSSNGDNTHLIYSYSPALRKWIRARGGLSKTRLITLRPPELWRYVRRCS